jgi:hypothetical protein
MVQVEELLRMIDRSQLDGPTIVLNFISRRVQPCKERVHPLYEYSGSGELVVGAAVRPDRIPPSTKHGEGVQVDNATIPCMPKIISNCNFDMQSY